MDEEKNELAELGDGGKLLLTSLGDEIVCIPSFLPHSGQTVVQIRPIQRIHIGVGINIIQINSHP